MALELEATTVADGCGVATGANFNEGANTVDAGGGTTVELNGIVISIELDVDGSSIVEVGSECDDDGTLVNEGSTMEELVMVGEGNGIIDAGCSAELGCLEATISSIWQKISVHSWYIVTHACTLPPSPPPVPRHSNSSRVMLRSSGGVTIMRLMILAPPESDWPNARTFPSAFIPQTLLERVTCPPFTIQVGSRLTNWNKNKLMSVLIVVHFRHLQSQNYMETWKAAWIYTV